MRYLVLKFDGSGLCVKGERHFRTYGVGTKTETDVSDNIEEPVPYTLLSNVLHVLCGEVPIPTKKSIGTKDMPKSRLNRVSVLDDIAKNSYVHYNRLLGHPVKVGKELKTDIGYTELVRTYKFNWNSNTKSMDEYHTWHYLKLHFGKDKEAHSLFLDMVRRTVGCEKLPDDIEECMHLCRKKCEGMSQEERDAIVLDTFGSLMKGKKTMTAIGAKYALTPWLSALGFKNGDSNNIKSSSRTPVIITSGIMTQLKIEGIIVCPIDNDAVVDKIMEGCGSATFMEGGIIRVIGLENSFPYPNKDIFFNRIFDENKQQNVDNKEIV